MTTIHDLRNGNIPQSRYQHGDIVIYYDGPFTVNIGQVRGDGNRPQLHFITQVDDKTAQAMIARARNRQGHEDAAWLAIDEAEDYLRTIADFEAGTGRI
jgi:hypothetical protein